TRDDDQPGSRRLVLRGYTEEMTEQRGDCHAYDKGGDPQSEVDEERAGDHPHRGVALAAGDVLRNVFHDRAANAQLEQRSVRRHRTHQHPERISVRLEAREQERREDEPDAGRGETAREVAERAGEQTPPDHTVFPVDIERVATA